MRGVDPRALTLRRYLNLAETLLMAETPASSRIAFRDMLEGGDLPPLMPDPTNDETPAAAAAVRRSAGRWDPETWGTSPNAQAGLAEVSARARPRVGDDGGVTAPLPGATGRLAPTPRAAP